MNKFHVFTIALVIAVAAARPEPPAEPLEGATLDAELLSRIRDLLTQDGPGFGGGSAGSSRASPVRSSAPAYSAPPAPPANNYGAPSGGGDTRSFANAAVPSGGITLLDPELAPLLTTFDLAVTTENRGRSSGY